MFKYLEVDQLELSPHRPRAARAVVNAVDLVNYRRTGVLAPLVARPTGVDGRYEMLLGERSWRIALAMGVPKVAVEIREVGDAQAQSLVGQGTQMTQVHPLEEAEALQELRSEYRIADLARLLGRTHSDVSHHLRLLRLAPQVKQWFRDGRLVYGQVRPLIGLDETIQVKLAKRMEALKATARDAEALVREYRTGLTSPTPATPAKPSADPNIVHLERELTDCLGCRVSIGSEKLEIHYYRDLDILEGVLQRLRTRPRITETNDAFWV